MNAHTHKLKVGALLSSGGLQSRIPVEWRRNLAPVMKCHDEFICSEFDSTRTQIAHIQSAHDKPQYLFAIGSSSAGNRVITRQPLSVTTTSSSMRAAE
jgi:hypothetical protein